MAYNTTHIVNAERVVEFDILRVFAIFGVIILHVSNMFVCAGSAQKLTIICFVASQLSHFGVPLFLIISGYSITTVFKKTGLAAREIVLKQAAKLLPAYFIVTLFLDFSFSPEKMTAAFVLTTLIKGTGHHHLYFVPLIFHLYLLWIVVDKLLTKHMGDMKTAVAVLAVTFCGTLFIYFYYQHFPWTGPLPDTFDGLEWIKIVMTSGFFAYFFLGYVIALKWLEIQKLLTNSLFFSICVVSTSIAAYSLAQSDYETFLSGKMTFLATTGYLRATVLLYSVSLFFSLTAALRLTRKFWAKWTLTRMVSKVSFDLYLIYLMHTYVQLLLWQYLHLWTWFREVTLVRHSIMLVFSFSLLIMFWSAVMSGMYRAISKLLLKLLVKLMPLKVNVLRGRI